MIISDMSEIPDTTSWAVPKRDLLEAWKRYTHEASEHSPDFEYAFVAGWLAAKGLDPDHNAGVLVGGGG